MPHPQPTVSPTLHLPLPPGVLARCRNLRQQATSAEGLLWALLRDRRMKSAKFRRQHPIGGYILDFYCPGARLAIEVDGGGHNGDRQMEDDQKRSEFLEVHGIQDLRFWNDEVLHQTEQVLQVIWDALPGVEE